MSLARFYVKHLESGLVQLSPEEAAHASASRRKTTGDEVELLDGRGLRGRGRIVAVDRRAVRIEVDTLIHQERAWPRISVAFALPKGPRQDVLIEKCTELGVVGFHPLETARSVAQASEHRLEKWRRTAIEAAKQSNQSWIPEFFPPAALTTLLELTGPFTVRAVASTAGTAALRIKPADHLLVFIGPEGGWSAEELECFESAGVLPVSLGPNTLRIETAAIAAAALVHAESNSSA